MKKLLWLWLLLSVTGLSFIGWNVSAQEVPTLEEQKRLAEEYSIPFERNIDAEQATLNAANGIEDESLEAQNIQERKIKEEAALQSALSTLIDQFNNEDYEWIIANASSLMTEETKALIMGKLQNKDQSLLFELKRADKLPEDGGLVRVVWKYSLETKWVSASSSISWLKTHFLFEEIDNELKLVSSSLFEPFSLFQTPFIVWLIVWLIALWVFWFFMLVHAIRKPIKNKVMRVLVIMFASWLWAIIYYFVVKRGFEERPEMLDSTLNPLQTGSNSSI